MIRSSLRTLRWLLGMLPVLYVNEHSITKPFSVLSPANFTMTGQLLASSVSADFNADGKADLAVLSYAVSTLGIGGESLNLTTLTIFIGKGDGMFLPGTIVATFATTGGRIAAADFNHDGRTDLALLSTYKNAISGNPGNFEISPGIGDGTFARPVQYASLLNPGEPFLVADVYRDGNQDVITDGAILLGNGDRTFRPGPSFAGYLLAVADLNGDGLADVVIDNEQQPSILLGRGDGTFRQGLPISSVQWSNFPSTPTQVQYIRLGDFNSDGKLDLAFSTPQPVVAVGTASPANMQILIGDGDGTFQSPKLFTGLGGPLAAFDLNQDGKLDLVSSYSVAQATVLFSNPTISIERIGTPFVQKGLSLPLVPDAPGLFAVDSSGVAAAAAVRVAPNGTQTPVPVFDCSSTPCKAVPIDVGGDPVYLSLYGTGFDYNPSGGIAGNVECTGAATYYFGPQGSVPGVNQINIGLAGARSGSPTISCEMIPQNTLNTFNPCYYIDVTSNPVTIAIK